MVLHGVTIKCRGIEGTWHTCMLYRVEVPYGSSQRQGMVQ